MLATGCPLSSCGAGPGDPCRYRSDSAVLRVHGAHAQRIRKATGNPHWAMGDPVPDTTATTTEESTA